jgi:hypothetical protein
MTSRGIGEQKAPAPKNEKPQEKKKIDEAGRAWKDISTYPHYELPLSDFRRPLLRPQCESMWLPEPVVKPLSGFPFTFFQPDFRISHKQLPDYSRSARKVLGTPNISPAKNLKPTLTPSAPQKSR